MRDLCRDLRPFASLAEMQAYNELATGGVESAAVVWGGYARKGKMVRDVSGKASPMQREGDPVARSVTHVRSLVRFSCLTLIGAIGSQGGGRKHLRHERDRRFTLN